MLISLFLFSIQVDIAKGSIQFMYIFLEFYIPMAVAFHIMFGGDKNIELMKAGGASSESLIYYETVQNMVIL